MRITEIEIDAELQDLIPQFMENRKKDISTLKDLVHDRDLEGIAQLAHKIKGVAAGYGFNFLSELALQLEHALKNENLPQLEILVEEMDTHFSSLRVHYVPQ